MSQSLSTEERLRQRMLGVAQAMLAAGLNKGTSGNIGCRCDDYFLVTPSGRPVEEMQAADMVALNFDGSSRTPGRPSSEWHFHRDILASRSEINAVVHCHSPFATTLACLHREIPPFHYMIAMAGADTIRCAPYALFGTEELSRHALAALTGRKACLLANHGMIALGRDLDDAFALAVEVEALCELYWRVLQVSEPHLLSAQQMREVLEKFKDYGRQAGDCSHDIT